MGTKPRKPATLPEPSSPPNEVELPERWSVQRKSELVLRLLRGEALDAVSRESQVPAHELESWKRIFLEQGIRGLKTRSDPEERELTLARAKIGELMMRLELAEHLIEKRGAHGRVEEAAAMREGVSPGTGRRYPLTMICAVFRVARATVYRTRALAVSGPPVAAKRGPKTRWNDAEVVAAIRAVLAATPFYGEGYRKVRARLAHRGLAIGGKRVLRLMRMHQLLAPRRLGPPNGDPVHAGTITTTRPDEMWGTDATRFYTEEDGWCGFFGAIDHCVDELVGWHTAKIGDRWAALEPLRQGVRRVFGHFAKDVARGLRIRCDWGPQYIADAWINEVKWMGMTITPSYVGEPECNGVIERFMRTLKEQCLYLHRFQSLVEARRIIGEFITHYNTEWLIERLGHQDAGGRANRGDGRLTDETRSPSGVRIDDRGWGRYLDISLPCPRNRERYTGVFDAVFEHTATPTAFYKSRIAWNGQGWDLTLKDGTVYVFGENGPLQAIRDRFGNQITLTRSNQTNPQFGNITRVTSPNGRALQFTYDLSGRITQVQDDLGRMVSYSYDASGRLASVTDPAGGVTQYTYDASHRMLTVTDARGITFLTNTYDANGRVTQQTLADQTTFQMAYTLDGNGKVTQTTVTDPRGVVRQVTFNADGYALTDTLALGMAEQQTTTYVRQAGNDFVQSATDALSRQTAYTYDTMGNVTSVTRLAGTPQAVSTTVTYEPTFNQVASVTSSTMA